ncbi:MAG: M6 family metalloprotease domain-containing protein [Paludibacteraceae bacterium]|nr:M6 family metalloprotease domain-containing protein [Paludibacteraceae bacterium]
MKKLLLSLLLAAATLHLFAVPAYRGWRTMTQPDGTTITVRQMGDEFFHYWENEAGQQVQQDDNGYWQVVGPAPTAQQRMTRRAASPKRKAPAAPIRRVGAAQTATRGLIILVSYKDVAFTQSSADMVQLANGANYTYNGAVGSVQKYFSDQSNGQYVPQFDVVGPYTLANKRAHYGGNDADENDVLPGDMVVEACQKADADGVDFTQYDGNRDGYVDFVYIIFAGKGEADGGPDESIWPHNWSLSSARYYNNCTYTASQCKFDGKTVNNYACSGEINGSTNKRAGIGTLCHEFSHVIGMPDYYDVDYGSNYNDDMTPGAWTIMDGGSYNSNGNCPPNYSTFDRYFMGWATPTILNSPANITLTTAFGDGYQINANGTLAAYTSTAIQYYLENRQKTGWDAGCPGHGMLVWKVMFNQSDWNNNGPNATAGTIRYGLASASGKTTGIGTGADPYPGTKNKTSFTPFTSYPLTNITESNGQISFVFISSPSCHNVVTNATNCTISPSTTCIENGESLTANIVPDDASYDITSVTVTLGSTTLSSGTHYTLTNNNTFLTIHSMAITGAVSDNLTITATATQNRWPYEVAWENATVSSESGSVTKGEELQLTITPAIGYVITGGNHLEVSMGGQKLTFGTDYTYTDNTLTIPSVTGAVEIYVMPGLNPANRIRFVQVTDLAMLTSGAQLLMTYGTTAVAGTTLSSSYLQSVSSGFTVENGEICVNKTDPNIAIFTLSGSSGAWVLTNQNSKKLSATSEAFEYDGTYNTWTIALTASKTVEMKTSNSNLVYYNASWPRFKPYSSAQKGINLYISTESLTQQTTTISFAHSENLTTKVGRTFYNPATSNFGTVVYTSSDNNVATVDEAGMVTPKAAETVTITASVAASSYYTAAQAQYTLTINPLAQYTQTWKNADETFTTTEVTEGNTLVLPTSTPAACSNGKKFVGWTATYPYSHETTAPAFAQEGDEVTAAATYYAVFAVQGDATQSQVTRTMTSFSSVEGYIDDDENVEYEAQQGTAATFPAVNSSQIRIYQNGGLLIVRATGDRTIQSVTIGSAMATKVQYAIASGDYNGTNQNITAGGKFTLSDQNASSITFKCTGTDQNSRLYLNYLSVTYAGEGGATYTYYQTDCSGEVTQKQDPTFAFTSASHQMEVGDTWTNTLSNTSTASPVSYTSSNTAVASVDESGNVTALKAGTTTITASIPSNATYNAAQATYTVTVVRKTPTASFTTATYYKTVGNAPFTQKVTTTSDGAVSYSSSDPLVANVNASTGEVTIRSAGETTITASITQTVTYNAAQASYTIKVVAGGGGGQGVCEGKKITSDYYESLDNLSGSDLFEAIHLIAKQGYKTLSYTDLWDAYCEIDINAQGKVWDMYSDATSYVCGGPAQGANASKEGDSYNREHSIPKSWFGGSTLTNTPGTDLFLVIPADGHVNTNRSNLAYGEVNTANYTSTSGCKKGTATSITITGGNTIAGNTGQSVSYPVSGENVFEPMDKYKGDFARIYFGAMVRWAGDYQSFTTSEGARIFQSQYDQTHYFGLTPYGVALLMKWHRQDPVSQKEIDRNDGIQAQQGNRNPFVDYPDLAEYLWGSKSGQAFNQSTTEGTFCTDYVVGGDDNPTQYTITWMADGIQHTQTQVNEGAKLIFPNNPDNCSSTRVFRGWYTTTLEQTNEQPTFISAGGAVQADATYYAVYANRVDAPSAAPHRVAAPTDNAIWYETFADWTQEDTPEQPGTSTFVYNQASLTYQCVNGSKNTRVYNDALAGGETPEMLLGKDNGAFVVSGIPISDATRMSLSFVSNRSTFSVSSSTNGVTIAGSGTNWIITIADNAPQTFNLTITNNGSENARVDDILLAVEAGGSSWTTTYDSYSTSCTTDETDDTRVTVTWISDGDVVDMKRYTVGAALKLPSTTPDECGNAHFVGWTEHGNYFNPTAAPEDLFTTAEGKTVTNDITYYAVFSSITTP